MGVVVAVFIVVDAALFGAGAAAGGVALRGAAGCVAVHSSARIDVSAGRWPAFIEGTSARSSEGWFMIRVRRVLSSTRTGIYYNKRFFCP